MAKPKLRFKRPDGAAYPDWETVQLADIATRVTRKNKDDETDVPLTIASIEGLVDQRTYFGKTVASKDMSGYFLLKNGEFAYNKSYSVGYDYGAIKRLDKYDQGALSTLYICFALNDTSWSDFMVQCFDSLKWNAEMPKICAEGARNHGLLNVAPADFFKISMALPTDPEERDRIVEGLQRITERIECQASRVAALETQKKELLRQVFAHEIRFKDDKGQDYPQWEEHPLSDYLSFQNGVNADREAYGKGVKLISVRDILSGRPIVYDTISGAVQIDDITLSRYAVAYGDVLFQRSSENYEDAGTANVYLDDKIATFSGFVIRGKKIAEYNPVFMYCALNDRYVRKQITRKAQGAQHVNVGQDTLASVIISVPSLPEQQRIADFFAALDAQIENERELLEDWRQLKKGLLQQMFI